MLHVCYASKSTTFLENFQNSKHKKNPEKSRLSEVLIVFCIRLKLSFRELRCSTSCFETVFLTFFHTWVTSKESSSFKNWSVFSVCFKKGSCNTMSDGTSLSCISAACYINKNVKFAFCLCCSEWLTNDNFQSL